MRPLVAGALPCPRATLTGLQRLRRAAAVLLLSAPLLPAAELVHIDFGGGGSAQTAVAGWNNLTAVNPGASIALTDYQTQSASGLSLEFTTNFFATNGSGVATAIGDFPATAVQDSFYHSGSATPTLLLTGFDPARSYDFTFTASRNGVSDARVARYTLTGAATQWTMLDASNNSSQLAQLTGLSPAANGTFTLVVSADPTNTNSSQFFYLGGLTIAGNDASLPAGILYYQGFDYGDTAGDLTALAGSDWTLTGGVDPLYSPRGFNHPTVGGTGGSLYTSDAYGSGGARRVDQALNVDLTGLDEVWVSTLMAMVNRPQASASADVTISIVQNDWQAAVNHAVGKVWNDTTGFKYAGTALTGADFTADVERPLHIVYRIAKGSAPEFWVNPTGTPTPGTGQTIGNVVNNLTTLTRCRINQASMGLHVDEIVVAENYAAIATLLTKPAAPSGSLLIDFGSGSYATTTSGWNNVTAHADTTTVHDLVDSGDGLDSGVNLRLLSGFSGSNTNGVNTAIGSFAATAVRDSFYSLGSATPSLELTGFDPTINYTFTFTASRNGVSDARVARYELAGATTAATTLDASNNAAATATIPALAPDATGRFVLTVSKDASNTNGSGYFYLGALKVEPASTTTLVPLTISGDQYRDPQGQPVRLWGVNAVAFFPNRAMADGYAQKLADMGVNCVRWHHLQRPSLDWNTKSRITALSTYETDSRTPDALAWERFDYLNARLRERGIYIMLSAEFSRKYHPGDVAVMPVNTTDDAAWADAMTSLNSSAPYGPTEPWRFAIDKRKMLHVFDERVARLSEEFLGELLDHVNPYTGLSYGDDPQVIAVELLNEFSSEYVIAAGNRYEKTINGVNELAYWNDALLQKWSAYATANGVTVGDFYAPSTNAQREARSDFLDGLDRDYAQRIKTLVTGLGYSKPVVFSNLWRGERPLKTNAEENTHIEDHTYSDPFIVDGPDDWVRRVGRSVVAGKPFFIGEINQREGSEHWSTDDPRRTMLPATLATYAAHHGWSGFAWFAMNHGDDNIDFIGRGANLSRNRSLGSLINDQMQLDHMATASRIFRRGLFTRSTSPITLWVDNPIWQWTYNGLVVQKYNYAAGWQSVNEIRKAFGTKPPGQDTAPFMTGSPSGTPLVSDTAQIRKNTTRKQLTGAAPQAEVFSGNLDASAPAGLQRIQINNTSGFATVMLVSDDAEALTVSRHLLVSRTHITSGGADVAGPGLTLNGLRAPTGGEFWRFTAVDGTSQTLTPSGGALALPTTGDWRQAELELAGP